MEAKESRNRGIRFYNLLDDYFLDVAQDQVFHVFLADEIFQLRYFGEVYPVFPVILLVRRTQTAFLKFVFSLAGRRSRCRKLCTNNREVIPPLDPFS